MGTSKWQTPLKGLLTALLAVSIVACGRQPTTAGQANAAQPGKAVRSLSVSGDLFELDGNATDDLNEKPYDWSNIFPTGSADHNTKIFVADVNGAFEDPDGFTEGSKATQDVDEWKWSGPNNAQPKADIQNAFAATYSKGSDLIIYFGADRLSNNGTTAFGFWFFTNPIGLNADKTFEGEHAVGDILVESEFTQGGAITSINVYRWVGTGGDQSGGTLDLLYAGQECKPYVADNPATVGIDESAANEQLVCGIVNTSTIAAPWAYKTDLKDYAEKEYPVSTFFEGGINLTKIFELYSPGTDVPCFGTFMAQSSASAKLDEALSDFAMGDLNTCGTITITKDADPNSAQNFSFTATGTGLSGFDLDDDADPTLSNTKTFSNLKPGPYSVTEAALPAGWVLNSIACTTTGNGTSTAADIPLRKANITLGYGGTVNCTFVNNRQPTLTVVKTVVNDDGGTLAVEDFKLYIGQEQVTSGVSKTLNPGAYSVSEEAKTGYAATIGGDCDAAGNVSLAVGDNKTCTITNNDIAPELTVIKHVVNDNGGTATAAAFTMSITGTVGDPITFAGAENPGVTTKLKAGTYTVGETGPTGYAASISGDCSTTGSVSLALGDKKTCTITNNDVQPKLIVIKHVVNDNGGTATAGDFTMSVNRSGNALDSFPGQESPGTEFGLSAGAYSVTETGPAGYAASFSTDCSGSIAIGETKTCTVTNDDIQPSLKVIKVVVNDNGGTKVASDFTFNVTGSSPSPASFAGAAGPNGTTVSLNAGNYNVTEQAVAGYTASYSTDCTGTIAVGESKTCTVTNDDQAAKLVVIKNVVNDNGGTKTAADFTMNVTGANPSPASFPGAGSPGTDVNINPGSYSVGETGPSGYAASYSADCAGTIALGQTKTCTVTNDDIAPKLTVVKVVVNDNGGTATVSSFPLFVDGNSVASGIKNSFNVGSHTVTETQLTGYEATFSGDCNSSGQVTLALTDDKTCTITNNDIAPTLTVVKYLNPTSDPGKFTLQIDSVNKATDVGNNGSTGPVAVNAGAHTVSEIAGTGTNLGDYQSVIGGDCAANGTITLGLAENKTCTITNNRKPQVTLYKTVNGAVRPDLDITFTLNPGSITRSTLGDQDGTLAFGNVNLNQKFTICEDALPAGYSATWTLNGQPISTYLPDPLDNSKICFDYTPTVAGEVISFAVANTYPLGNARTIGYWKNWSICSGGNQVNTAKKNGGGANGFWLLDDLLPVLLGDASVDTCTEGVNILSKTQFTGGKSMASDAAYSLAAQLMAAKLNIAANAGTSCVLPYIAQADALLKKIGFTGTGTELPSNSKNATVVADRNEALFLAGKLDAYNNNTLTCP